MTYLGYHGTNEQNEKNILSMNFRKSTGDNHWFGEGIYFFIDGINAESLDNLAAQWAIDQAWDNKDRKLKYTNYIVLKATIHLAPETIFDLRDENNNRIFNQVRNKILEAIKDKGKIINGDYKDSIVFKYIQEKFKIKAIIGNVYIRLGIQRICKIHSNISNCTIICVYDNQAISIEDIESVKKGTIE
ncbi:MAG: hypothetical protein RR303_11205 [Bacteroidales bacterium]